MVLHCSVTPVWCYCHWCYTAVLQNRLLFLALIVLLEQPPTRAAHCSRTAGAAGGGNCNWKLDRQKGKRLTRQFSLKLPFPHQVFVLEGRSLWQRGSDFVGARLHWEWNAKVTRGAFWRVELFVRKERRRNVHNCICPARSCTHPLIQNWSQARAIPGGDLTQLSSRI